MRGPFGVRIPIQNMRLKAARTPGPLFAMQISQINAKNERGCREHAHTRKNMRCLICIKAERITLPGIIARLLSSPSNVAFP